MHGPPYFDWRLDRWKIGLALLLWVGLLVFLPAQPPRANPQGASPIARPGQRPVVGASTQMGAALALTEEPGQPVASPLTPPTVEVTPPPQTVESTSRNPDPPQLMILEPGQGPLTNSTPLFFGQTETDGLVEILVEGRRYSVLADKDGYWQFAPSAPLPVGMTWVQVRGADASGAARSQTVSRMALVGASAQAISPPVILTPLPFAGKLENSTPYFSGRGPAGRRLVFFAQAEAEGVSAESGQMLGEVVVAGDGAWGWQMAAPLPAGQTTLWAVVVDAGSVPLSRSWPVTLDVAGSAAPSVTVELPVPVVGATR